MNPKELEEKLKPKPMFEKFGFRHDVGNQISGRRPVVVIKGDKFQTDDKEAKDIEDHLKNEKVGFKCLHYSVSEGVGAATITLVKKNEEDFVEVRVKTRDDTAVEGEDYEAFDEVITMKEGILEKDI